MEYDTTNLELQVMKNEYEWLLNEEVKKVLNDLKYLISEALKNLNFQVDPFAESQVKPEKFLLSCPNGLHQSKCMVTLFGDLISEADLGVRLQKQPVIIYQTRIYPEMPWKLQQIQDAGNHLRHALSSVESQKLVPSFTSGSQVLTFIENLLSRLKLGRDCLSVPKIHTLEDLLKSSLATNAFKPPLPQDTVATFFVQAHKLVLVVYHLTSNTQNKPEIASRYQLESSIPWLNDALLLFTVALLKCQQLRDKVAFFASYEKTSNCVETSHRSFDLRVKEEIHSQHLMQEASGLGSKTVQLSSAAGQSSGSSWSGTSSAEVTSF